MSGATLEQPPTPEAATFTDGIHGGVFSRKFSWLGSQLLWGYTGTMFSDSYFQLVIKAGPTSILPAYRCTLPEGRCWGKGGTRAQELCLHFISPLSLLKCYSLQQTLSINSPHYSELEGVEEKQPSQSRWILGCKDFFERQAEQTHIA